MLGILLDGLDLEITDKLNTRFYCNCSKDRFAKGLYSLGHDEMQDMISAGRDIEVNCQFCGKHYYFSVDELKEIESLRD